jgi:hypothetical protein
MQTLLPPRQKGGGCFHPPGPVPVRFQLPKTPLGKFGRRRQPSPLTPGRHAPKPAP